MVKNSATTARIKKASLCMAGKSPLVIKTSIRIVKRDVGLIKDIFNPKNKATATTIVNKISKNSLMSK